MKFIEEDEVVGNVYKTTNYSKFNIVLSNRDINISNLKRIRRSISIKQYSKPILVTREKNYILDGNHTFQVCKELNKPVYYTFLDNVKTEEEIVRCIKDLNSSGKTWTLKDYIKYYTVLKKEDYMLLSKLMNDFPKIKSTNTYINIAQDSFRRERTSNKDNSKEGPSGYIKEGNFKVKDYQKAVTVCKMLEDFSCLEIFKNAVFKESLIRAFRCEGYNHKDFLRKLKTNKEKLRNYNNYIDYLQLFSTIYNHNKKNNRVQFDIEYYKSIEQRRKCS